MYKISVLPGDGIGNEVINEALRVIDADNILSDKLELHKFPCGGAYYLKEGREWSVEAEEFTYKEADAILLGAIGANHPDGRPVRLPDNNLAGYNVVIGLRLGLDLYANVRPVKLYEGVPTVLAQKTPSDIDMVIVRENTEGLYAPVRGILTRGGMGEVAIDTRIITRKGSERVARYAFELAKTRHGAPVDQKKRVTCVDKSNLLAGCQLFRTIFDEIALEYKGIEPDHAYVDAWAQWCVKKPEFYDVVVVPNAFGDIITDLGGAIQGGLGMAPAGNIGSNHGVFEPVHGSAPSHAGKSTANPIAAILATSMMVDWLGTRKKDRTLKEASERITKAVTMVLKEGTVRTYDLCQGVWKDITPSSTSQTGDEIIKHLKSME